MIGHVPQFYTSVSWSAGSAGTVVLHATSVTLTSFDFLFFGRITLIATALSEVLRCDAYYFSIFSTLVRQFLAIC